MRVCLFGLFSFAKPGVLPLIQPYICPDFSALSLCVYSWWFCPHFIGEEERGKKPKLALCWIQLVNRPTFSPCMKPLCPINKSKRNGCVFLLCDNDFIRSMGKYCSRPYKNADHLGGDARLQFSHAGANAEHKSKIHSFTQSRFGPSPDRLHNSIL